jgi:hypothetical protein
MMSDTERRRYVPVSVPSDRDAFRVPVWVSNDEVLVCTDKNAYRCFNLDHAPDEIKAALTMVHAFPFDNRHPEWAVNPYNAYVPRDPRQAEVGWRVTEEMYILVLSRGFMESIYNRG